MAVEALAGCDLPDQRLENLFAPVLDRIPGDIAEYSNEFVVHNARAKAAFLASPTMAHPDLLYPDVDVAVLTAQQRAIYELIADLPSGGDGLQQLYVDLAMERSAEIGRRLAMAAGSSFDFARLDRRLYGEPSQEYFELVRPALSGKAIKPPKVPSTVAIGRVRAYIDSVAPRINEWLIDTKDGQLFEPEEIVKYLQMAITHVPLLCGWRAVIGTGRKQNMSVNHDKCRVTVSPGTRVSFRELQKLFGHELLGHAVWAQQNKQAPLHILRRGLAGTSKVSEGLATVVSQVLMGETEELAGVEGYLAVGLALGMDGSGGHNFREVFEIMKDYYIRQDPSRGIDDAIEKASSRAGRTFRGIKRGARGECSRKQIIYLEGNLAVWEGIESEPKYFNKLKLGRWDPTNREQEAALIQLIVR